MTIVKGGTTTISSLGEFQLVPGQVSLVVANDGDGDAFTATVDGDTGAQNYLMYRAFIRDTATAWTAGGNRAGDGAIQVTGLDNNTWYEAYAYSVQEGSYGQASPVLRFKVSDGGTLATQTLAEAGGGAKHEYHIRTLQADTWERWYKIRIIEWDTLKPAVAEKYYDDSNQIVANVRERSVGAGAENTWMVVTFIEIANSGWTNDYAETRRVDITGPVRTVRTYGISKALASVGIPALGDLLDAGSGLAIPACVSRHVDDKHYPGLWVWTIDWRAHTVFAF